MPPQAHPLLTLRHKNSESYKVSELGSGTMGFVKQVFDEYFGLREEAQFSHARDLWGNDLLDHIYTHEGSKRKGAKARRDFMLKMNGKKIVVEVEAYGGMDKGMKQIQGYMDAEDTPYAIVTDSWTWRFFKTGYSETDYEEWTLEDLLSDDGKSFLDTFYNTYEYYLHRLRHLQTQDFDIQAFHTGLITIAEALVSDFRFMGLFDRATTDKHQAKREIQTAYSLIIQFLLIKIIQNKRNIALIDVKTIITHLEHQHRAEIYEEALGQIDRLGEFYKSYHNQQQDLIDKILSQFRTKFGTTKFTLDAVRPFLDLYQFIFSFDFSSVTQDLFGAVYENYLKELYKDDDTKKGQVFTPPEIVDFMLDEIGYTSEHIVSTITDYGLHQIKDELDPLGNFNLPGLSLIDPACGSGTFLYKAAARIINAIYTLRKKNLLTDLEAGYLSESLIVNNLVGFDIEAFPLYLAEMNILQTLLFFNIDPQTGKVLNPIDKAIKIFSTDDSIAEFADLEQSMIRDLTEIVENEAFASSLFRKRDNNAIVQLKADIQDFDPAVIIDRLTLEYGLTEIQRPVYLLTDQTLLTKTIKTFWDKYKKKLTKITDYNALSEFIHSHDEVVFGAWQKAMKTHKGKIEAMRDKLVELVGKQETMRSKFDFVIANPPYVATNAKQKELFGYNINDKKYTTIDTKYDNYKEGLKFAYQKPNGTTSKFNLYGYFYYLAFFLLKQEGKLCFITPRSIINKLSFFKLRKFLKYEGTINKIIDFKEGELFYERGMNQNITVGTDSAIVLASKNLEHNETTYVTYTGPKGSLTLDDFKKQHHIETIEYNELFERSLPNGQQYFIDYFYGLQKRDSDFHFSIYPRLFLDKISEQKKGYPIYQHTGYYVNQNDLFEYYDYDYHGATQTRPTCEHIKEKQYRLTIEYFNRKRVVAFTDYKRIQQRNRFASIGISKSDNLGEMMFIFGLLNSPYIHNILDEDFGGVFTLTNLKLLPVPLIDTDHKRDLKNRLIENSEKIINLCKSTPPSSGHLPSEGRTSLTWADICETAFDPDALGEVIVGLKSSVSFLDTSFQKEAVLQMAKDSNAQPHDPLPDEIIEALGDDVTTDIETLEQERDEIVRELYGV